MDTFEHNARMTHEEATLASLEDIGKNMAQFALLEVMMEDNNDEV